MNKSQMYRPHMIGRVVLLFSVLSGGFLTGTGAVIRLKDDAAIQGSVLAEKKDQIVVDVGFTVLLIPRDQIVQMDEADARLEGISPWDRAVIAGNQVEDLLFRITDGRGPERTVRELVRLRGESVVQVRTPGGLGSGFFINEDGYLITNFHVIESETQISIEVYHQTGGQIDRANYKDIRIVAMNKFKDLALLKVEDEDAPRFAPVALGNSDALSVGDRVFAIGSPLGLERTVTEGILSTKTRQLQGNLYLQTTTQINPGNSGGPLFNMKGEVVGVTNMKMTFAEGLAFAIPVESVAYFVKHRDSFAYDNDNPSSPYRYLEPPGRISKSNPDE